MKISLKPVLAGLAGLAGVAALAPLAFSGSAAAAPVLQGSPQIRTAGGAAALSAGDSNDTFTLRLPAGAECGGDAVAGYVIQGYMVSTAINPATLQFNSEGPVPLVFGSPQSSFKHNLYDLNGSPYFGFPAAGDDPVITNIPDMSYGVWTPGDVPAGEYNIGIACVKSSAVEEYWNTVITVAPNAGDGSGNFNWSIPGPANKPTLTGATGSQDTCTAVFTPAFSNPAATSYTATATPQGGGSAVTATGTGSPIAIGGLTNFQAYDVTVTATNELGTSAASNSIACTPSFTRPAVTNLQAAVSGPGDRSATLTWTAPTGAAPTGYNVVVTGPTPGTFSNVSGTTLELPNLNYGSYTATVTPVHASAPNGNPASVTFAITPVPAPDPCVTNPKGLLSGLLWQLGIKALATPLCRLGL